MFSLVHNVRLCHLLDGVVEEVELPLGVGATVGIVVPLPVVGSQ